MEGLLLLCLDQQQVLVAVIQILEPRLRLSELILEVALLLGLVVRFFLYKYMYVVRLPISSTSIRWLLYRGTRCWDRGPRCPSRDLFGGVPIWWPAIGWPPSSWWSPLDRHWLGASCSNDQSRSGAPTSSNGCPSWDHHCTPPTYEAPSWHHGGGSIL